MTPFFNIDIWYSTENKLYKTIICKRMRILRFRKSEMNTYMCHFCLFAVFNCFFIHAKQEKGNKKNLSYSMFLLTRDIKWWENGLAQNFTSSKGKGGQASSVGVLVSQAGPEIHTWGT